MKREIVAAIIIWVNYFVEYSQRVHDKPKHVEEDGKSV